MQFLKYFSGEELFWKWKFWFFTVHYQSELDLAIKSICLVRLSYRLGNVMGREQN